MEIIIPDKLARHFDIDWSCFGEEVNMIKFEVSDKNMVKSRQNEFASSHILTAF